MSTRRDTTDEILKVLARSKRGFTPDDIMALREDLAGMTAADLAASFKQQVGAAESAGAGAARAACIAIHHARRKLLASTETFLELVIARAEADTGASLAGLPKRARTSVPQLVRATAGIIEPEQLAAAATAIARERSLAYDLA